METKINIAAILKDKPQGTKLYNLLYNTDVELETIVTTGTKTIVWCTDKIDNNEVSHRFYSEFGTIEGYPEGLQILLPSKEMRDWAKFSWKKGDVLANGEGDYCVFKEFAHSSYQTVKAVFVKRNKESIHSDSCLLDTKDWHKASHSCTATYINTIEKELSGKLNMETLNYIQCDECKYRLVCNGEPLTSGSTGSCDHRVISNTPIFPKIKTPPDERYADIWNW